MQVLLQNSRKLGNFNQKCLKKFEISKKSQNFDQDCREIAKFHASERFFSSASGQIPPEQQCNSRRIPCTANKQVKHQLDGEILYKSFGWEFSTGDAERVCKRIGGLGQ